MLLAQLRTGSRGGAYRWQEALHAGLPWVQWNPEQQAQAIEDYVAALERTMAGEPSPLDARTLEILQPCVDALRRGEGAPRGLGL